LVPSKFRKSINTEGETFPFVNDDNEIYFASDGHPSGRIGYFVSKINTDGSFGKVQNGYGGQL
jgi:hypothetical protein